MSFFQILSLRQAKRTTPAEPPPPAADTRITMSENYSSFTGAQLWNDSVNSFDNNGLYYRDRIVWHDGQTALIYGTPYNLKPYNQARLLMFDETNGFDRPITVGNTQAAADTHSVPIIKAHSNSWWVLQEETHDTPIGVYRSDSTQVYDYYYFARQSTIGTKMSYCHLIEKPDGNCVLWARGHQPNETGFYSIWVAESSAGMATWSAQRQITQRPTGADPTLRHYPFLPFGRYHANGKYYLIWSARNDTGPTFYRHHVATTPDSGADSFRVFTNLEETFSHDVDTDGNLTDAISAANFAYLTMDSSTTQAGAPLATVSPEGTFFAVICATNGSESFFMKYFDTAWNTVNINLPVGTIDGIGTSLAFNYLLAFSDNEIRMQAFFQHGAILKPHWIQTNNQGSTWADLGDLNPDITSTTSNNPIRMFVPNNILEIPNNRNFPMYFSVADASGGTASLFCRVAAFGSIQPMAGLSVPDMDISGQTALNYNSQGLFDFEYIASFMTLSGSNITALADKFGLHAATTPNSDPQWDGVNVATLTAAGSQSFTVGTPSTIVDSDSFTYMSICTYVSGMLLNFSLTSQSARTVQFNLDNGVIRLRVATSTGTHFVDATELFNDGLFHGITVTTDGRANVNLYIDGKRQFFSTTLTDASAIGIWAQIGKTALVTASNAVNMGLLDTSGANVFSSKTSKRDVLNDGVIPIVILRQFQKALCTKYGITYRGAEQFSIPTGLTL